MDKATALTVLARFREAVESQQVKVDKLILFGSYAAGTNREGSDIDVVVLSSDFAGKDFWERTDVLSQAIYEVFEPIEAVGLTPEEWDKGDSAIVEYAKSGEVVYGRHQDQN
jgi:predicted nucleotidyltransferase